MDKYYYPGFLLDTTNSKSGTWILVWQEILSGAQTKFLDDAGIEIVPPAVHEFHITNKEPHFAPGVQNDPNAGYTPPTMEEYIAAVKAGPEAMNALVASAKKAFEASNAVQELAQGETPGILATPNPEETSSSAIQSFPKATQE